MKTRHLYSLIVIMLGLNIGQVSNNKRLNAEVQHIRQEIMNDRDLQIANEKKRLEFEASLNNAMVSSDSMTSLSAFTLIYVYTDTQCGKCITEDIALIREYCKGRSVHIYPVIEGTRSNYALLNSDLYDMHYTRMDRGTVVFPTVEGRIVRFLAVVNTKGEIVSSFYPSIASEKQKVMYLNFVKERFL